MDHQIAAAVMDERLQRLQAEIIAGQLAFNQSTVGKRTTVLLERTGKYAGQLLGKSPWLQSVIVENTDARIGDLSEVDIVAAGPNSLIGAVAAQQAA